MESSQHETHTLQEKDAVASNIHSTSDPIEKQDDEVLFMSGAKLYMLFFGLALAVFIMALDMVRYQSQYSTPERLRLTFK